MTCLVTTQRALKKAGEAFNNLLPPYDRELLKCASGRHEYVMNDYIKQYRRLPMIKKNIKKLQRLIESGIMASNSLKLLIESYANTLGDGILLRRLKTAAITQEMAILSSRLEIRTLFENAQKEYHFKNISQEINETQQWVLINKKIFETVQIINAEFDINTVALIVSHAVAMVKMSSDAMTRIQTLLLQDNHDIGPIQLLDQFAAVKETLRSVGHSLAEIRETDGMELIQNLTKLRAKVKEFTESTILYISE